MICDSPRLKTQNADVFLLNRDFTDFISKVLCDLVRIFCQPRQTHECEFLDGLW